MLPDEINKVKLSFLLVILIIFLLFFFIIPNLRQNSSQEDSYIFIFSINSLTKNHLPCYGYHRNTTPNICNLKKDGILFRNAIVQSTHTPTSFPSFITSTSPLKNKIYTRWKILDDSFVTIGEIFRQNGYSSVFSSDDGHFYEKNIIQGFEFVEPQKSVFKDEVDTNDKLLFLDYHRKPHAPYEPPMECRNIYNKDNKIYDKEFEYLTPANGTINLTKKHRKDLINLYDEEIKCADSRFGEYVDILKDIGIYNESFIIIFSDHGQLFGEHGRYFHGGTPFEELINVPLIMKFPNNKYSGKTVKDVVRLIDILPTLADFYDMDFDADGTSILPILEGHELGLEAYTLFNYFLTETHSLRTDDYKIIVEYTKHSREKKTSFFKIKNGEDIEIHYPRKKAELEEKLDRKLLGVEAFPMLGPVIRNGTIKECSKNPEVQPKLCYDLKGMNETISELIK
ncbi:MAG: sulfatase [Candidatus Aenigmatarchaeota archaeon]